MAQSVVLRSSVGAGAGPRAVERVRRGEVAFVRGGGAAPEARWGTAGGGFGVSSAGGAVGAVSNFASGCASLTRSLVRAAALLCSGCASLVGAATVGNE